MTGLSYTVLTGAKSVDGSIKNIVNDSKVPSAIILAMAEQRIYVDLRLRVREMLTTFTGTIAADADTMALPTRHLETSKIQYAGTAKDGIGIRRKLPDTVEDEFSYDASGARVTGKPRSFYATASVFQFEVKALEEYSVRGWHFQKPAPLAVTSNETNLLTDTYPNVLIPAVSWIAHQHFLRNETEAAAQKGLAEEAVFLANQQFDMEFGQALYEPLVPQ